MNKYETLIKEVEGLINEQDKNLLNENANKDSKVIPTQRDLLAGIIAKHYAKNYILPKDVVQAHEKGEIHFHDLDYSPFFPSFNCMLVDLKGMFEHGFKLGNAEIECPKSIMTATALAAQIVAQVSSSTYGGTTLNRLDEVLAPYVLASYNKHLKKADQYHIEDKATYAMEQTEKECFDAFQALEYEFNTMFSSNGQTPFVTVGFGLGTSWEERLIQKSILQVRINGLGKNKKTAVFPKLIFSLKDGVNLKPSDINYDIKQLALECTSKRIYPDIINYDKVVEVTGGFKHCMGCVDGEEVIVYQENGKTFVKSFSDFWSDHKNLGISVSGVSEYIKTKGIKILDIDGSFTEIKGIIKNPDKGDWRLVKFSNGRSLICTGDHPFPVKGRGRTFADSMKNGDVVQGHINTTGSSLDKSVELNIAWLDGLLISDSSFVHNIRISLGNDEKDIGDRAISIMNMRWPNNTHSYIKQNRGVKGVYLDILTRGNGVGKICKDLQVLFNGIKKADRRIPNYVFNSSIDIKESFMAGIIDADGYIHPKSNTVQVGSTNKVFALQQMVLAQMLGIKASVYLNKYSKNHNKYRYRVEFKPNDGIIDKMTSSKKISMIDKRYKSYPTTECVVREIINLGYRNEFSYDVTTESDTFVVSGLASHNCRSFLGEWENPNTEKPQYEGRNNLGVVTINIPRIAIEANKNKERFWQILDERLEIAHKALEQRINRLDNTKARVAPILYVEGACGVRLNPDDNISEIFKNGRASISLGYIGLHEAIIALFGNETHIFDDKEKQNFALSIVKRLKEATDKWKKESGYGYSVYSTPSENLCNRFCEIDFNQFGSIEGVTDKEYYTNSFHLDVAKDTDPYSKIVFEEKYPEFASGGFICYGEFPNLRHNLKAIEDIWNFSYKHVPYYGTNFPVDQCFECGFEGEFYCTNKGFSCPQCKNRDPNKVSVIRRVCGYLGSPDTRPFNKGKQKEVLGRKKHVK